MRPPHVVGGASRILGAADGALPGWLDHATPAEDLAPEVTFLLKGSVYVGDPNSTSQFDQPEFNPIVTLPNFPRRDANRASSMEVIGHEPELVDYYRRAVAQLGARFNPDQVPFWLTFALRSEALGISIPFAWSDNPHDMAAVSSWLRGEPSPQNYWDGDQGWEFEAVRHDGRLYVRHGDLDTGKEYVALSANDGEFRGRFADYEARANPMIRRLAKAIPIDFWL